MMEAISLRITFVGMTLITVFLNVYTFHDYSPGNVKSHTTATAIMITTPSTQPTPLASTASPVTTAPIASPPVSAAPVTAPPVSPPSSSQPTNTNATATARQSNTSLSLLFDLQNSQWPREQPRPRSDCKVVFKNPDLQLCHVLPFAGSNFGDELGPPVVKRILEYYFGGCSTEDLPTYDLIQLYTSGAGFSNRTRNCLMTVGLLWRMVVTGDHLWGTGVAAEGTVKYRCKRAKTNQNNGGVDLVTNLTIYSTRGPKSAEEMRKYCTGASWANTRKQPPHINLETAGDAGYLVPYLFPEIMNERSEPTKEYCAVPHAQEEANRAFQRVPKDFILTPRQPWRNMTRALMDCREVVSSSLHGVILSEALRIPSRRVKLTLKPGHLKFTDFYKSLRGAEPSDANNITFARQDILQPLSSVNSDQYARRILKTFPIHLFDVQYADPATGGRLERSLPGSPH